MSDLNFDNMDMYGDEDYWNNQENDIEYTYFSTCQEIFFYCLNPVIKQIIAGNLPNLLLIIIWLLFLAILNKNKCQHSYNCLHILSSTFGFIIAYHSVGQSSSILLLPILGAYSIISLYNSMPVMRSTINRGPAILALCLMTQLFCEFGMDPVVWNRIRGLAMILAMKLVSLGFDLDSFSVIVTPNFCEYLGYSLNVATVIFGPWLSFNDYLSVITTRHTNFNVRELLKTSSVYMKSLLFLLYSTCIISHLIVDDSHKWMVAYRDAQAFRFSHYFVCALSEANLRLFKLISAETEESSDDMPAVKSKAHSVVARAFQIEMPRSLVEVVVNWNLPMHQWLKQYIFLPTRRYGTFVAVMSTYIASSLLHGINFQLSAVLLSLGIYTYTEHVLRQRLSVIFDACLNARRCRNCSHSQQSGLLIWVVNIGFSLLAVFHLTYLGLMFDNSSQQSQGYSMSHTLSKWANLDYLSHLVAAFTFVFYFLIRN